MNEGDNFKTYVQVATVFREDGVMLPSEIIWKNGVSFPIKRIREIKYGFSFWGNMCNKYTVEIENEKKHLYFEHNPEPTPNKTPLGRWFVEKKKI